MSIYTDYSYETEEIVGLGLNILGGIAIFGIVMFLISIAISIVMIISFWKIYTKLGKPGWTALIPFYNNWVLFETQGVQGWWSLIPFANIIFMYIVYYRLAKSFKKSTVFAICTIFFPYVCLPILAFSKANVVGQNNENVLYNQNTDINQNYQNVNNNYNTQYQQTDTNNNYNTQAQQTDMNNNYNTQYQQNNTNNNDIEQSNINEINQNTNTSFQENVVTNKICPNCQTTNSNESMFCSNCGTRI